MATKEPVFNKNKSILFGKDEPPDKLWAVWAVSTVSAVEKIIGDRGIINVRTFENEITGGMNP